MLQVSDGGENLEHLERVLREKALRSMQTSHDSQPEGGAQSGSEEESEG